MAKAGSITKACDLAKEFNKIHPEQQVKITDNSKNVIMNYVNGKSEIIDRMKYIACKAKDVQK
jgi:hypothetical protein